MCLLDKKAAEHEELLGDIEELENYIERLALTVEVSYDVDFHTTVIQKYSMLINKIKDSSLTELDKEIMVSTIKELFIEHGLNKKDRK